MGGSETGRVQTRPVVSLTEFLQQESGKRLESMFRRFSQPREVVPRARPGLSHSALRRTAARLRAGKIHNIDPRIPSHVMADVIEKSIAQDLMVQQVVDEAHELRQMFQEFEEKEETARGRSLVAGFHRLKKSPEATDPESPAAEKVRRLNRERGMSWGGGGRGKSDPQMTQMDADGC